jgi:HK97 family phage major capsid protein
MRTLQELQDERARLLNVIDDVIRTAQADGGRALTDDERTRHDDAVTALEGPDGVDAQIVIRTAEAGDADRAAAHIARSARFNVPNVNVRGNESVGAGVTRDLDEILWATDTVVRATSGNAQIPIEQVIVRSKHDNGPGKLAPRITAFKLEDRELVRSFQQTVADMAIVGMMVDRDANTSAKGFQVARSLPQFKDRWNGILRAMDVDTSAEGTEWVPTGIGASLHEKVRASGKVAPLFARINLPTNPWKWPLEGADLTAYRVAEPTADNASKVTASTAGTAAATFDAEILGARTLWSRSLDADSAIAIMGFQQRKLVQAFVDAEERAVLDGDSDGTHQDADVQAIGATDARSAWDGLRKKALAQTVATATTCTALNLGIVRKAMGKWGVNPADLAFIIGVSNYHALLADTNLLTVDKMGPNAVILNGQVGSVFGVPVIVSEHVREVLNASGVEDGITQTKTYMLCVNRNEWALGTRMALDVETDDSIYRESYQRVAVAFMREDLQCIGSAATDENTAIAYNVTP